MHTRKTVIFTLTGLLDFLLGVLRVWFLNFSKNKYLLKNTRHSLVSQAGMSVPGLLKQTQQAWHDACAECGRISDQEYCEPAEMF
jgi:hypothetical protein